VTLAGHAIVVAIAACSLLACGGSGDGTEAAAVAGPAVRPFAETPSLVLGSGDEADDVAIHPSGFVIGTSKNGRGGLEVYDLKAKRRQWLQLGQTNNVDLRGTTAVASNRSRERVDVLSFKAGRLAFVRSFPVPYEPYGVCLYRKTVFVTANGEGRVEQYSLSGKLLRRLSGIRSQSEGCVADDPRGVLYVAEEDRGIWRFEAAPTAGHSGRLVDSVDSGNLTADVEGLTLVGNRLIASSQGDSSFALYRDDRFVRRFRVSANGPIDEVTGTDGLAASASLGLLVVHDEDNAGGETSNYKFVKLGHLF
jgi:3-phytase